MQSAQMQYGEIIDMPFPQVDPMGSKEEVTQLAMQLLRQTQAIETSENAVVHIMGELNLTYALVNMLKASGYTCVASTSTREVYEEELGKKVVFFKFVRFREY